MFVIPAAELAEREGPGPRRSVIDAAHLAQQARSAFTGAKLAAGLRIEAGLQNMAAPVRTATCVTLGLAVALMIFLAGARVVPRGETPGWDTSSPGDCQLLAQALAAHMASGEGMVEDLPL